MCKGGMEVGTCCSALHAGSVPHNTHSPNDTHYTAADMIGCPAHVCLQAYLCEIIDELQQRRKVAAVI
jgi:hypothetical protein